MTRDSWKLLGEWCALVLLACAALLVAAIALGQSYAPEGAGGDHGAGSKSGEAVRAREGGPGPLRPAAEATDALPLLEATDSEAARHRGEAREAVAPRDAAAPGPLAAGAVALLARCLAGEAGIKPAPDHAAILHVLHRLASRRRQSVEHVTRGHCNAAVSPKGTARVDGLRLASPQDWEALVQYVEAFEPDETPNPCRGAITWGGRKIDSDRLRMDARIAALDWEPVTCTAQTANTFLRVKR